MAQVRNRMKTSMKRGKHRPTRPRRGPSVHVVFGAAALDAAHVQRIVCQCAARFSWISRVRHAVNFFFSLTLDTGGAVLHGINAHTFWDAAMYFGKLGHDAAVLDPTLEITTSFVALHAL